MTTSEQISLTKRPRRNRKSSAIRAMVQETNLQPQHLVAPLFVVDGQQQNQPIDSMPGVNRLSIDMLIREVESLYSLGIRAIELFPVILNELKDPNGSEAVNANNLLFRAIKSLKNAVPDICVMADIALDPFTSHGHDGILGNNGDVHNDETLVQLGKMSLHAAESGVDIVAPSDMMDGRIGYIRKSLDDANFTNVSILSYAAKYASAFYSPFRDALNSAPKFGDKKSYQMNPGNIREALLEVALDEAEGADMILIKPALAYLDVVSEVRKKTNLPVGAYHVSGEYAMVMAAAQKGWLDADRVMMECLLSMRRAGSDFILTYAAKRIAEML